MPIKFDDLRHVQRRFLKIARVALGGFALLGSLPAFSQNNGPVAPTPSVLAVPEITVLGDSEKTSTLDFVPTVSELSGARLQRKKQSTLGETLGREVGVSSTFFGPNASRPVIRGLDGERVRVLQGGLGVLDASGASQDHAVALDPLTVERIEIVRGPAALLYGSSAVGGVVNTITNCVPETYQSGLRGRAETKYSTVDQGRSLGANLDYGSLDHWVVHVDGGIRGADDYHIPGYARTQALRNSQPLAAGEAESNGQVANSFNRSWNGAIGSSYVSDRGFAGGAYSNYNSNYGTVAERGVFIRMKQQRADLAAGWKPEGWIRSVRLKNSYSDYQHEEVEQGAVGTTFKNRGDETRLEFAHAKTGDFSGQFGVQTNFFKFEALGDEAFLPATNNHLYSLFGYEEGDFGKFKPSLGLRGDVARVISEDSSSFGASRTKEFTGGSALLGFLYELIPQNSIVLNMGYTERAPDYQELFAHGPHVATKAYETGNVNLGKERSQSVELSLRHKDETKQVTVGVFYQDFQDFIALVSTGVPSPNPDLTAQEYRAVPARFYGGEVEYRQELPGALGSFLPGVLEVEAKLDFVNASNRDTGRSLPRIPPLRETLGLLYKASSYQVNGEIQRSERQRQVADNETETPAYTFVNIGVEAPVRFMGMSLDGFVRAQNLFDQKGRTHVSVLKDIAPLPGRNFIIGVQALL